MSDASPLAGQRPVWLDDKTKSVMDRAIAREQALSRMLMTYIVTGLVFMLLPGTFLGVLSPGQAPTHEESCFSEGKVSGGAYFGDDLPRRIHSQTGYFRQPLHRVLMLTE